MFYDPRLRPAQPATPARDAFTIHRAEVPPSEGRDGLSLAFIREGAGGYPLVLLHGYPETKRIWWRNIGALADAGHEVIALDLRGYGDSDLSAADVYDLAAWSRDIYLLVHDVLGLPHCGVVAGDLGGAISCDLVHRYPGFVDKLVFFDSVPPFLFDDFAAAGIDIASIRAIGDGPTSDYRYLQGVTPDELAAELDTPAKRRRYVAGMYGHRLWASPGTFTAADVDFMTEPFATEERLRAGWAAYQLMHGRAISEPPILDRKVDVPTSILYGMDDHVVGPDFLPTCEWRSPTAPALWCSPGRDISCSGNARTCSTRWSPPISATFVFATGDRHGPTLSASTLMYRVLGGRRPRLRPAPATTARGLGRMPIPTRAV